MGEVRTKILLENEEDRILFERGFLKKEEVRTASVEAVVDTGVVMNLFPQDLVESLGLKQDGSIIVTLATEEKRELRIAQMVAVTVAGRRWISDCLVGPPQSEPLIGQLTLERLDLVVDPAKKTVSPRPESPFLPSLKLK